MTNPTRVLLWSVAWTVACSADAPIDEPVPDEIDPACAGEDAPAASARAGDELPWDLDRGFDSDRPVCSPDAPGCDRLDAPDAIEEHVDLEGIASVDDDDGGARVAYGLSDPLLNGAYRTWPNGRIPYAFARDSSGAIQVNAATRTALAQAMTNWEQKTEGRIKFRAKTSTDKAYVIIKQGSPRVRPFVGYRKDQVQELYLRDSEYITVIKHELGHVVGLHHEQRRTDRLSYIQVRSGNIVDTTTCRYQFSTCSDCKRVGSYDRRSVMHYRTTDLANCRTGPVLLELDGSPIDHYWQLSAKDLTTVATMYAAAPPPPPPPSQPVLPEGGSLVSGGLCMAVAGGSAEPGAPVEARACDGAGAQDWRVTADGQLRVQHSLQCAAVVGCSAAGAVVEQAPCAAGAPDQQWRFTTMELVHGATGKCADLGGGADAPVRFAACSGAASQQLAYAAADEALTADGLCLTTSAAAAAGDDVVLRACDGGEHQRWIQARGGFVPRTNTGRCLRVEGGAATGTRLELGDCTDTADQRWALRGAIRDGRAELCLTGGEAAGGPLALAACDGSARQTWMLWSR